MSAIEALTLYLSIGAILGTFAALGLIAYLGLQVRELRDKLDEYERNQR